MNLKERSTYLLIGVLVVILFIMAIGASNTTEQGRYQIACTGGNVFVADTSTGVVKEVWTSIGGHGQLDKPFTSMLASPEPVTR